MESDLPIRLEREGSLALLTLCRPERKNVVTHAWARALKAHADTIHADPSVDCVLLQAEGPIFCAGADVKEMATYADDLPGFIESLITPAHEAVLRLATIPAPIVGLLRGTAAGGGVSLALACDFLVASRSARLVLAYAQLGTTPDCGLTHALIDRLGAQRALQLFLMSDVLDMTQATQLGLVHEVVEDSQTEAAVRRMVTRLGRLPAGDAKRLFLHERAEQLAKRLERERALFLTCSRTEDFRERVLAFAQARRE